MNKKQTKLSWLLAIAVMSISFFMTAQAGEAEVVDVTIDSIGENKYRISTTIKHADTGWDHYANAWLVYDQQGNVLGERVLFHPHVDEQPFTRSLTLTIPDNVKIIIIKAKDSVHGLNDSGTEVVVP